MERSRTNWVVDNYRCERCGYKLRRRTNFCPHCGRQAQQGPLVENISLLYWIAVDDAYTCSCCGQTVTKTYNYCPKCGGVNKGENVE